MLKLEFKPMQPGSRLWRESLGPGNPQPGNGVVGSLGLVGAQQAGSMIRFALHVGWDVAVSPHPGMLGTLPNFSQAC